MFTTHGHHIPGSPLEEKGPDHSVARCGGPGLCEECAKETTLYRAGQMEVTAKADDFHTRARMIVANYCNGNLDGERGTTVMSYENVYVISFSQLHGQWSGILATIFVDHMLYRVAFDPNDDTKSVLAAYQQIDIVTYP